MKRFLLYVLCFILFNGCGVISESSYYAVSDGLNQKLPFLETFLDLNSFEEVYMKDTIKSAVGSFPSINQPIALVQASDAARYLQHECYGRLFNDTILSMGKMMVKLVNHRQNESVCIMGFVGSIVTLGAGMTIFPLKKQRCWNTVDVSIYDLDGNLVRTYNGRGSDTYYVGVMGLDIEDLKVQRIQLGAFKDAFCDAISAINEESDAVMKILLKKFYEVDEQRKLLAQNSRKYERQCRLAKFYLRNGAPLKAALLSEEALRLDNANLDAYAVRGEAFAQMGYYDLAIHDFLNGLKLKPNDFYLSKLSALVSYESKNYYNALSYLNRIKGSESFTDELRFMKGDCEQRVGLYYASNDDFKQLYRTRNGDEMLRSRIAYNNEMIAFELKQIEEKRKNALRHQQQVLSAVQQAQQSINSSLQQWSGTSSNSQTSSFGNNYTGTGFSNTGSGSSVSQLEEVTCSFCKGTGVNPGIETVPTYGNDCEMSVHCQYCSNPKPHYHKKCPSCNGRGTVKKLVAKKLP